MTTENGQSVAPLHPIVIPSYEAYRCILIDPPWPQTMSGKYKSSKNQRADE